MESLTLSRDGHYHDLYDELLASNTWSGKILFQDSYDPCLKLWFEVKVYGLRKKNRCRPYKWIGRFKMWNFKSEIIAEGPCKSLKDAQRQVNALNLSPYAKSTLQNFYNKNHATCVWTKRNHNSYQPTRYDVIMDNPQDFVPFASMFIPLPHSFNHWGNYMQTSHIPTGTFITFQSNTWSQIKISTSCTSGSSTPIPKNLSPWTKD